ncbi:hypothetical protein, partial [Streptococcus sobrinus]|uniref:hypothetical protein n=1 Tax=Streptococcus sobrinus TaxID=1310 RepID=UPI0005169C6B
MQKKSSIFRKIFKIYHGMIAKNSLKRLYNQSFKDFTKDYKIKCNRLHKVLQFAQRGVTLELCKSAYKNGGKLYERKVVAEGDCLSNLSSF